MLRWLFPITCSLCGKASQLTICADCLATLPHVPRPICLYCGAPAPGDLQDAYRCPACKSKPRPFDFARSALLTSDKSMDLIHKLKYKGEAHLAAAMAPALVELWHNTPELTEYASGAIVPVPISKLHLRRRGYNQAEELAHPLAKALHMPLLAPLQRIDVKTDSQTRLSAAARLNNARLIYHAGKAYKNSAKSLPTHLVLVDDVYTTGATVRACAAVLKSLPGVKKVAVLTLMRVANSR